MTNKRIDELYVRMNDRENERENERTVWTVFFARSYVDYGTGYERVWIYHIEEAFGQGCIIDFNEVKNRMSKEDKLKIYGRELYDVERKYFFPLIDISDYIVAAPAWNHIRRGKYTEGVIIEIEYAISVGKKVFGIVGDDMKIIKEEDIKEIKTKTFKLE